MIIVRYGKGGRPFSDHLCEETLLEAEKSGGDVLFFTSSENMVTAARVLKCEGKLPDLRIEWQHSADEEPWDLEVNKDGRLPTWPKGFCDHIDDWLSRLLSGHLGKKEGG
jgi:hypothetical protein